MNLARSCFGSSFKCRIWAEVEL